MPSKKPMVTFHTEQWIIDAMKMIAQENGRSMSKEIEHLCKLHIQEYERQHSGKGSNNS